MANLNINANLDTLRDPNNTSNRFRIFKAFTHATVFNETRTGPTATIFPTDIDPHVFPSFVTIWVDLDAALDLILIRRKGGVSKESTLTTLTVGRPYTYTIILSSDGETFNLRTNATGGITPQTYGVGYACATEELTYAS